MAAISTSRTSTDKHHPSLDLTLNTLLATPRRAQAPGRIAPCPRSTQLEDSPARTLRAPGSRAYVAPHTG